MYFAGAERGLYRNQSGLGVSYLVWVCAGLRFGQPGEGPNTDRPASLNHYSKGAVCRWLFDTMCGIRVDGENHFVIAPRPGGHFTYARAEYHSIYGKVESGWEKTEKGTVFTVSVPANCTAAVCLPDGREVKQDSGKMSYTV